MKEQDNDHKNWLDKHSKTRRGKLYLLNLELRGLDKGLKNYDGQTYLAAALSIATKGTRMEADAREMIMTIVPGFYESEPLTSSELPLSL